MSKVSLSKEFRFFKLVGDPKGNEIKQGFNGIDELIKKHMGG
jgi:hypothetical protein